MQTFHKGVALRGFDRSILFRWHRIRLIKASYWGISKRCVYPILQNHSKFDWSTSVASLFCYIRVKHHSESK